MSLMKKDNSSYERYKSIIMDYKFETLEKLSNAAVKVDEAQMARIKSEPQFQTLSENFEQAYAAFKAAYPDVWSFQTLGRDGNMGWNYRLKDSATVRFRLTIEAGTAVRKVIVQLLLGMIGRLRVPTALQIDEEEFRARTLRRLPEDLREQITPYL